MDRLRSLQADAKEKEGRRWRCGLRLALIDPAAVADRPQLAVAHPDALQPFLGNSRGQTRPAAAVAAAQGVAIAEKDILVLRTGWPGYWYSVPHEPVQNFGNAYLFLQPDLFAGQQLGEIQLGFYNDQFLIGTFLGLTAKQRLPRQCPR